MSGVMVFRLPMPPNLANGRMHWATKNRARKAYLKACDNRQLVGLAPRPPIKPLSRATLTSVMTLWNPMDTDNLIARHKWAIDWLVSRGYLVGDSPDHLQWGAFPCQIVNRRTEPELRLTLEIPSPGAI